MRKGITIISLTLVIVFISSFSNNAEGDLRLRKAYSMPPHKWPKPSVSPGVEWVELGVLPESPLEKQKDSLEYIIELGKVLFFDTRLSGSGNISCATCHDPALNWTDGKEKSIGHEGAINKRNSPTIQNTWFYNRLFWDGRARDLQDQAFAPINSESEMSSEMPELMDKLRKIKGYHILFKSAFGNNEITPNKLTQAIAIFEKTIVSRKSRFDEFLEGNKKAMSNQEIRGLHLSRTKAKCMNCHHGPLFTDNLFHNNGFHSSADPATDKGYYAVTHMEKDIGKFKTPSLRDVMNTGPWMHNGMMKSMDAVLANYSKGANNNGGADSLVHNLFLTQKEHTDLLAFLHAISAPAADFSKPVLPK